MNLNDEMYARGRMWVPRSSLYQFQQEIDQLKREIFRLQKQVSFMAELWAAEKHDCPINAPTEEAKKYKEDIIKLTYPTPAKVVKKEEQ